MAMTLDGTSGITQMTGSIVMSGSTSGTTTIIPSAVAGTTTVTMPAATGTMMVSGNMPAFSAYLSTSQIISSNTFTKLQANTEEFDTASCYDNATNYRFTPNVAGYYQINGNIQLGASSGLSNNNGCFIYKNGSRFKDGNLQSVTANAGTLMFSVVSALIYLNGSTDYVELYGLCTGTGTISFGSSGSSTVSWFQGVLVRGA